LKALDGGADESLHGVRMLLQELRRGRDAVAVKIEAVIAVEERADIFRIDALGLELQRGVEDLPDDRVDLLLRQQRFAQLGIDELNLDLVDVDAAMRGEGRKQPEAGIVGRGAEDLALELP